MNLNTARVFVRDIHRAKAFYGQVLGLKLRADGALQGWCVFDAGNCELVVEAVAAAAPADEQALVGRFTGLSFRVDDVHASHRALAAKGVTFSGLPERQAWGGTLATLRDPEGNELQIVQRPAAA
ncbi:VOC family protein [uncultured Methylibium sp.]|uniref:VOC family protein n=1 Tax=uncultured Methylibium sp. TaxID=381093 RepID=UPI0025D0672A|nr:VOC family protein [uncultured Methylibium sp.]